MSGHNKWSTIKHKKGAADAKRGKVFSRLIKEVTVAARMGGGDPAGNPRLRSALAASNAANVPKDSVDRAIKRGTGELEGVAYDEIDYEGYGPGGVAVYIQAMTDNKNRTVAEIRHVFTKYNGNLGEAGCVGWMFSKTGQIIIDKQAISEDKLMELAIEVGADDVKDEGDVFEVACPPNDVDQVAEAIREAGIEVQSAQAAMVPQNTVKVEGRNAEVLVRLLTALEDLDDIQNVWANYDIDDQLLEQLAG